MVRRHTTEPASPSSFDPILEEITGGEVQNHMLSNNDLMVIQRDVSVARHLPLQCV